MKLPGKLEVIIALGLIMGPPSFIGGVLSYKNGSTLEAAAYFTIQSLANSTVLCGWIRHNESRPRYIPPHARIY